MNDALLALGPQTCPCRGAHLEIDDGRMGCEQLCKIGPDLLLEGAQLRLLRDDCGIQIAQPVPSVLHEPHLAGTQTVFRV